MELSTCAIPEELQQLWDKYKATQEAEGKKVHSGGGFSGKGFKFDEQEANAVKESKKLQKAALGLADSDDDEDIENDIDQQIENMFAAKRNIKETPVISTNITVPATTSTTVGTTTSTSTTTTTTAPATVPVSLVNTSTDKLELARRLASRINVAKNLGYEAKGATQQAAEAIMKGASSQPLITV